MTALVSMCLIDGLKDRFGALLHSSHCLAGGAEVAALVVSLLTASFFTVEG
jgi:hypothetical protein